MQYRVRQTGKATYLYFEEDRIEAIRPHADGVELRLAYNPDYVGNTAYKWDSSTEQHVLRLSQGQALTVVEQDRAQQTGYCSPCFDYGKSADPGECVRCRLIQALRKKGDYRKVSPTTVPMTTQRSPLLCWLLLAAVLVTSWALCAWTQAASENQALRQKMERVK